MTQLLKKFDNVLLASMKKANNNSIPNTIRINGVLLPNTPTPTPTLTKTPGASPSQTPTVTPTLTVTPTKTLTPTVTKTQTPTPSITPTHTPTPTSNPVIPTCAVLYNDNQDKVYYYNVSTNTSTLLTMPAEYSGGSDIAHTSNKLWEPGGIDFTEYNITLPSFTVTFNRYINFPSGFSNSAGLAAISDTVILAVNGANNKVVEINVSGTTAIMTTKFSLILNRYITGDFIKTTTNKFLALNNDNTYCYLTQWDYLTGTLEVDIQLTMCGTFGIFESNGNIYITAKYLDITKLYVVNKNSPYTVSYVQEFGNVVNGASQVPTCLTENLESNVATLRVNNNAGNNAYYVNTKTIELPLVSNGTYNFVVDWGDGTTSTVTSYSSSGRTHTYTTSTLLWAYDIKLTGQVDGFSYAALSNDQCKLLDRIYNWGAIKFINTSVGQSIDLFAACVHLKMDTCVNAPNLGVITSLENCFQYCNDLGKVGGLEYWNVSNITNMSRMFQETYKGNGPSLVPQDLSGWDTSKVTDMSYMYYLSRHNNNIGNWNVTGVTNMYHMFYGATNFNNGNSDSIKNWNTYSVNNVGGMFYSAITFNQPLTNFNFTNVTDTTEMFSNCYIFNQDCSNWERTGSTMQWITNTFNMFYGCRKFNGAINTWNLQRLVTPQQMFAYCYEFNKPMNSWNTSSFSDMSGMFKNCFSLNQNLGSWNLSSLTQAIDKFWALRTDDANRPRSTFDLTPANLTNTLLGWSTNINTVSNYQYISFPNTADAGTCTGLTQMKSKGWRIVWVNNTGGTTTSTC